MTSQSTHLDLIKDSKIGQILLEYNQQDKFTCGQLYISLFQCIINRESNISLNNSVDQHNCILLIRQILASKPVKVNNSFILLL